MQRMRGRRLPDSPAYQNTFQPGDFLHDPKTGSWWARPPQGQTICLDDHIVVEHGNRGITVEPEIRALGMTNPGWIGKLTKGIWFSE